jgi:hypothetical protein
MSGVAWWGTMLAAFVTELYVEAEKGGRRTDKIKRRPPWSIKRMANGPRGEQLGVSNAGNPRSWHCDNRNVDETLPSRPRHMHCSHPLHFSNCSQLSTRSSILKHSLPQSLLSPSIFRSFLNSANRTPAFLGDALTWAWAQSRPFGVVGHHEVQSVYQMPAVESPLRR